MAATAKQTKLPTMSVDLWHAACKRSSCATAFSLGQGQPRCTRPVLHQRACHISGHSHQAGCVHAQDQTEQLHPAAPAHCVHAAVHVATCSRTFMSALSRAPTADNTVQLCPVPAVLQRSHNSSMPGRWCGHDTLQEQAALAITKENADQNCASWRAAEQAAVSAAGPAMLLAEEAQRYHADTVSAPYYHSVKPQLTQRVVRGVLCHTPLLPERCCCHLLGRRPHYLLLMARHHAHNSTCPARKQEH